jgi:hydroxymethylpyrimidine/phosphomethylpyrimidine kinase
MKAAGDRKVLSIAGLDPSGSAGLLRDVQTIRELGAEPFGICSALTVQSQTESRKLIWVDSALILEQLDCLASAHTIDAVKIGVAESPELVLQIRERLPNTVIVFDPVLSASNGLEFHRQPDSWQVVLGVVDLLTPNAEEAMAIFPSASAEEAAVAMAARSNGKYVLLKGGHRLDRPGVDTLYGAGEVIDFPPAEQLDSSVRGTGCTLSSAIAVHLAQGFGMEDTVERSKLYVAEYIKSRSRTKTAAHV